MKDGKNGFVVSTRDRVLRAWENSTELVRDYEVYSKQITDNSVVSSLFGDFAEDEAKHAAKLLELLRGFEKEK
ncbi:MAG: rubrerythrin [Firmicutes bacterium]|nr:rubrerythrin [Bacillota bacterium]MBQ4539371.1 rubrerythrin [Oscillospiraceae bacterium]